MTESKERQIWGKFYLVPIPIFNPSPYLASIGVDWAARNTNLKEAVWQCRISLAYSTTLLRQAAAAEELSCIVWSLMTRENAQGHFFSHYSNSNTVSLCWECLEDPPQHRYNAITCTSWCVLSLSCQVYPASHPARNGRERERQQK